MIEHGQIVVPLGALGIVPDHPFELRERLAEAAAVEQHLHLGEAELIEVGASVERGDGHVGFPPWF